MNTLVIETLRHKFEPTTAAAGYPLTYSKSGWVTGKFYNCKLSSVFQPIFNPIKGKVIGHAAYIRSESDGKIALSPWDIFTKASGNKNRSNLEHLGRVVHALNYFNEASKLSRLFMDVNFHLLESVQDDHGCAFGNFLNLIGVKTSQIVIQIPTILNCNLNRLQHVIIKYRSRGYRIAVNYNCQTSDWMTQLGSSCPDIVRIDARYLLRHNTTESLVDMAHHYGATILVTGVETSEQMIVAIRAGADYLKGDYFGETMRAITMNTPHQLSEKFNAERWHQQVSSAYKESRLG